jgi:esterase/lipase
LILRLSLPVAFGGQGIDMERYYLTEIITKDKLIHQGIYFQPQTKSDTAVLWVHGLTGTFYGDIVLFNMLVNQLNLMGIGFASFNNRGHDSIVGIRRIDSQSPTGYSHTNGGAGYEKFEDCIFDIDAGITFLRNLGYSKIIIAGHSTGANKVCYYGGTVDDNRLVGVVLASPISDRLMEEKTNIRLKKNLHQMKKMVEKGKGEYLVNNLTFFPTTPKRYLSLFEKGSTEDVFDYGENKLKLKEFSKIIKPLLVVLTEKDEYADRPITEIKSVFDKHSKSIKYQSKIIPESFHGFDGKEDVFAKLITDWIIYVIK